MFTEIIYPLRKIGGPYNTSANKPIITIAELILTIKTVSTNQIK